MPGNLPQNELWKSLPFGDKDAFVDFLGQHALWHTALDKVVRAAGGAAYPSLPLGDGPSPTDEGGDWHLAHQAVHDGAAVGLGLSAAPDFTAYDLDHRDEFATWTWLHAQEHQRLRVAAGV